MNHCKTEPLFETRGNNPPRLIGYVCIEHGEVFTPSMNVSQKQIYKEARPPWFMGGWRKNKKHRLRMKASKKRSKE